MEFINNRQVNLWRGSSEPPTKYHIWIKDNKLLLYNGEKWMVFVDNFESLSEIQKAVENLSNSTVNGTPIKDNPVLSSLNVLIGQKINNYAATTNIYTILNDLDSAQQEGYSIDISEDLDGAIKVSIGSHSFKIQTTGGSLSVRTNDNNDTIIFDSNALTSVPAEAPLEWTANRKLIHQDSKVTQGTYGSDSNQSEASIIKVPSITVDKKGHITNIDDKNITIRDYVKQLSPDENNNTDKPVLLAHSNTGEQSNPVRQANGLTYNDKTGDLKTKGSIEIGGGAEIKGGDLKVANGYKIYGDVYGSISGTATPRIHSSKEPQYGAASTNLYGHVIVQDELGTTAPLPTSTNSDPNKTELDLGVQVVAASPLMVWNALETAKQFTKQYTKNYFSDDFEEKGEKIYLSWKEIT